MKIGKSLVDLATEIGRQAETKRDFLVRTEALTMHSNGKSEIELESVGKFGVTDHAHAQIRERLGIPAVYYDRLRKEHPVLLDYNVNELLRAKPEQRMVRTLDGQARAFLSKSYRCLDNIDLAEAVLPVFGEQSLEVRSCDITPSKLYLKVVSRSRELEVKRGDPVCAGIMISNSEVGMGALKVVPFIERLVCTNGLIAEDYSQKKYHVGKAVESEHIEMYRDETLQADDRAFFLKVGDTIRGVLQGPFFEAIVNQMKEAADRFITGDPIKAVEEIATRLRITEKEKGGGLKHLINGGDLSQWGVVNAITRTAEDADDYDRATELESAGGRVLTLGPNDWRVIAEAA